MKALRAVLLVAAIAALAPATADAGGYATVGLSSLPDGTQPGKPWRVDLTVLQHGRTPLAGVEPTITIRNGERTELFEATPVKGKRGVYHADVVFPTAGRWDYEIADGFTATHQYAPVQIGAPQAAPAAPASAPGDDGLPWTTALVAALAAGLAAAIVSALMMRRRRPRGLAPAA